MPAATYLSARHVDYALRRIFFSKRPRELCLAAIILSSTFIILQIRVWYNATPSHASKTEAWHAPESLITPKVQSSPLPHTPQLLHNYYDEFSNEKLSRLMTLFNGWLISNYKYATSDLCCPSILAFEHLNPLIADIKSDVDTSS
jgi:hypothetical protein